jgi:peptide chain release factor 2
MVTRELADPLIWNNHDKAQKLGQRRASLEKIVLPLRTLEKELSETSELLSLAIEDGVAATIQSIADDILQLEVKVEELEFHRMFSLPFDQNNAFLDVQSGSGGTEAQDWANMLLRMYLRWAERKGLSAEIIELSPGEIAGIKSATVQFRGDYAYGWLRSETGVHRLVRKSPFDSGSRRHTSFAAIFVSPEINDDIEIEISPADIRVDVYRASGAGGQHVNKTESAVRVTHIPTNVVTQCQSGRSQHKNKETAMKQLKAKLYEIEEQKKKQEQKIEEDSKDDIGWGSQIRSYVLDQSRVKDLRTNVETGNTQAVLDGDIDIFIEATLKQG